uniref:Putative secreted protein n=1 Tax=Ixodes ricinus TaxID=34613 RepID=A0A6B0UHJ1_IXORI
MPHMIDSRSPQPIIIIVIVILSLYLPIKVVLAMVNLQEQTWQSKGKFSPTVDQKNIMFTKPLCPTYVLPHKGGVFPLSVSPLVLHSLYKRISTGEKAELVKT